MNRHPMSLLFLLKKLFTVCLVLSVCAIQDAPVGAQDAPVSADPKSKTPAWEILADQVTHDEKTQQYLATGNVTITKGNRKLSADRVRFHHKTMRVFADGHVVMVAGDDILTGTRLEMNLDSETGTVFNGKIFIKKNHFYIRGDRLKKTGEDTYQADRASITSCDGESPDWRITGRDVKVTVEGYGSVWHAALWAKKMPVMYSPYLLFPVKQKRQTGLLPPQFGHSDRKGFEYVQPFFWAIDDSSDATFYEHYMGDRGNKLGAEYRYIRSRRTKGAVMYDYLDDRQIDDGTPDNTDQWGYEGDRFDRTNSSRYWFRMKHDQELPGGFLGRLDLDVASDQDYLHEFKNGYASFSETEDYFLEEFGRDLDDYDDPVRVNSLHVFRNWNLYSLNAEARWYDNVVKRRWQENDNTLQKLPFVGFTALKQPVVASSPFFYDLESEYNRFFREDGTTGHRLDVHPRVYFPFRHKNYFTLEPSVGFRETLWYMDDWDGMRADGRDTFSRELPDARLDLSTEVSRGFNVDGETIDKIKHTIRPQVVYEYIPPRSQDELPEFDELDHIDKTSVVTYSVTNYFSMRTRRVEETGGADQPSRYDTGGQDPASSYDYRTFGRFKLEQSYDLNETEPDRPFSPILAELDFSPNRYLVLQTDARWSTYDSQFTEHNTALRLADKRGDRFFAEHRYTRDKKETIYTDAILRLHEKLSMYAQYERNIKDQLDIEYGLGFLFMAPCWSLDIGWSDEEGDKRYAVMINLYGIGGIGQEYAGREIKNPFEFE